MEAIQEIKSVKHELLLLFVATVLVFVNYQYSTAPYYQKISKIEDGEVVVRNDSITTVVIPDDKR